MIQQQEKKFILSSGIAMNHYQRCLQHGLTKIPMYIPRTDLFIHMHGTLYVKLVPNLSSKQTKRWNSAAVEWI